MSTSSERREAGRVTLAPGTGICRLQIADGPDLRVQAVDVSERGILVEVPAEHVQHFPPLTSRLALSAAMGSRTECAPLNLACEAEVVWMGGDAKSGARRYRSGLRFIDLSPTSLEALRNWLG